MKIKDIELLCFVEEYKRSVKDGQEYFVDLDIEKSTIQAKEITQLADEDISDFWYLENQFVELTVDRFNIDVIEKVK
ncbi:hypothetical protein OPJ22_000111 [Listeria innocua]|uniref:hypothetical protein n=1 Tax=Listeria TaxID=1637 RepID=UPI000F150E75|nr:MULTISPECIES: hypothetical protein [Listeria]EAD5868685.1 hypothetical protein [Listeria innocua]EAF5675656.1 hypothetical protein [Listeria innocua]EDO1175637.1 hypothetical protein [Listeria innocua]EHF3600226.1 hypothetical protein [Listeria innocua]EHF3615182.1 hypothetical protein [Listeria innocua]